MAKPAARITALQIAFGIGVVVVIGRAGWLQLIRGGELSRKAARERTKARELPASRGTIYDRNGTPLVISQPKYRVQLAIKEVKDTSLLIRRAVSELGISRDSLRRTFQRGKPLYPYFYGPFTAMEVASLRAMKGVHLETAYSRAYPSGVLAGPIIGAVAGDGSGGESGLERSLDSVLAGLPGLTIDLKDPSGAQFESPDRLVREPVAGNDVVLTIDAELQAIAENALTQALKDNKAEAGDVVFLDQKTGELLAMASRAEHGATASASVFTSPFEPGSTAKPFTAAALLALGRVDSAETVSGENGEWTYAIGTRGNTRTIHDTHPHKEPLTLSRAIQVSSNIAMAKFSSKLSAEEQYEMLRAFGFGAQTGAEFPSEASGGLRRPDKWREGYSKQSMAMGYEFQVTPVQLAAAYGVFANDGILLTPTLIREVRDRDGRVLYRHQPEVVRRVISPEVAARIRTFLAEAASDSGTGGEAKLRFGILGKTGTAKQAEGGSYASGEYRASFAAIFPARDPQLVAVVTIARPHAGEYYGGLVAAPLTAKMLRQALAARRSVLDRIALEENAGEPVRARRAPDKPNPEPETAPSRSVRLPLGASPDAPEPVVLVPEVTGHSVRAAVYALHQRGLRVNVEGTGVVTRSVPAAGDSLAAGKTVVLYAESGAKTP